MLPGFVIGTPIGSSSAVADTSNPIVLENQQPGTGAWQLNQPGYQTADDVSQQVKGYASATSVNEGGSITFYVTVNPVQTFTIDIYRMGWYGGLGGRLMFHVGPLAGVRQQICATDATTGMIACAWSPSYRLTVPTSWTTGIYLALLTNAANFQSYVPFVVRDDARTADLIFQSSVTTWQAYNDYPADNATGKSLYDFNSYGANTVAGTPRAVKVSFDRPYAGSGAGNFFLFEVNFLRWIERSGYDASYTTDLDTSETQVSSSPTRDSCRSVMMSTGRRRCSTVYRLRATPEPT